MSVLTEDVRYIKRRIHVRQQPSQCAVIAAVAVSAGWRPVQRATVQSDHSVCTVPCILTSCNMDNDTWTRASALFDELYELPEADRIPT